MSQEEDKIEEDLQNLEEKMVRAQAEYITRLHEKSMKAKTYSLTMDLTIQKMKERQEQR